MLVQDAPRFALLAVSRSDAAHVALCKPRVWSARQGKANMEHGLATTLNRRDLPGGQWVPAVHIRIPSQHRQSFGPKTMLLNQHELVCPWKFHDGNPNPFPLHGVRTRCIPRLATLDTLVSFSECARLFQNGRSYDFFFTFRTFPPLASGSVYYSCSDTAKRCMLRYRIVLILKCTAPLIAYLRAFSCTHCTGGTAIPR
jgi:hypothetical protein